MSHLVIIQAIVFISAFLLFQLELIVGKAILPYFGGSYLVWGACVVFFQAALMAGYYFANFILRRVPGRTYRLFHLGLFLLPFLSYPGQPLVFSAPTGKWPMVLEVFVDLLVGIGPVFFILSTMSIFWQAWFAQSSLPQRENPYQLFASSNGGSLSALLSYPLLFELCWGLDVQQQFWRIFYLALWALQAWAVLAIPWRKEGGKEEKGCPLLSHRPRREPRRSTGG